MNLDKQKLNKLKTLIGFSIKSKKLKYGIDNITNKAHLIIVSDELSESSIERLKRQTTKNRFVLKLLPKDTFRELFVEGVKTVSIEKCELSNAIYQLMEEI